MGRLQIVTVCLMMLTIVATTTATATTDYQQVLQSRIIEFSEELRVALGLNHTDLSEMATHRIRLTFGRYCVYSDSYTWTRWENILVVLPIELHGCNLFSSKAHEWFDRHKDWYFRFGGTASELLPPQHAQSEVLSVIKLTKKIYGQ